MINLIQEDFDLARTIVNDIVDDTDVCQIKSKLTDISKNYNGNKKRHFLVHLNALFGNVILNELTWRCDDASNRAHEARLVTKQLNKNKEKDEFDK